MPADSVSCLQLLAGQQQEQLCLRYASWCSVRAAVVLEHVAYAAPTRLLLSICAGASYTQVLERRKNVSMRVNTKEPGDVFGEVSLMYNCPRTATVAATTDAVVWVLERDVFRWGAGSVAVQQQQLIAWFRTLCCVMASLQPV
jgi:hypothetical protein